MPPTPDDPERDTDTPRGRAGQLERADGGLLRTDADPDDPEATGPFRVWAQLFEPGDVTRGGDGSDDAGGERNERAAHWNESALQEGIDEFAPSERFRKHIVDGHPQNPSIRDILGEALNAAIDDEHGVVLEGEVDGRETARLIQRDRVGISPYVYRTLGEYNEDKDAHEVEEILGVRDYGIVRNGEGPSATIHLGESPLARAEADADGAPTAEALAAVFEPGDGGRGGGEAGQPPGKESGGTDSETPENGGIGGTAKATGQEGEAETMADPDDPAPDDPDPEDPGSSGDGDADAEQLRAELQELREENEQLREELDENRAEKIEELRTRVSELEDENEGLEEDLEPIEAEAAEAMSAHTGLPEEMVREKFEVGEMVETLRAAGAEEDGERESASVALTRTADPQTGDPPPTGSGGVETLSADEQEQVEVLEKRREVVERRGMDDYAETLGERIEALKNGETAERAAAGGAD
jgi:ElaB/YqjD/DUF883 family membrane-anchored ribosome-binding protein